MTAMREGAENMPKNCRRIKNYEFKILLKSVLHLSSPKNSLPHFDKNKSLIRKMR